MSEYEKKLAKSRLLKAARAGEYLFRCNSGSAWNGKFISNVRGVLKLGMASVIKLLPPGTPDFCGFKPVVITQDMVGKKVAVFLCEEHKATKSDRMREAQMKAKAVIVNAGGIHRVVRHDETVEEVGPLG
jgi:hypothetical protein